MNLENEIILGKSEINILNMYIYGGMIVSYIRIKEIKTPLIFVNIRLYKDIDTKDWYIRKGRFGRLKRLK